MYKILKCDGDAYITDRIIDSARTYKSNTGIAATLDLQKIVGLTFSGSTPNVELSRLLLHFDLTDLQDLYNTNKIDITNPSFFCKLKLTDVYGGQPTPRGFNIKIFPLSASFTEGVGKDVVLYSDHDACNFLSASVSTPWIMSGCFSGSHATSLCDYITDFSSTQYFTTGEEDLFVDVTSIISATLNHTIPDKGFRISYGSAEENDGSTYFVKRFASRQSYNVDKHPKLVFGFDDSVRDDTQNMSFDSPGYLFMYNYSFGNLTNILSASTNITGTNCIALKLSTEISGGYYSLFFTGSQHHIGNVPYTGIYSASVNIPSTDSVILSKINVSGSVDFIPTWCSTDGTVGYFTGSRFTVTRASRTSTHVDNKGVYVTVTNLNTDHKQDETIVVNVNIFQNNVAMKLVKTPIILPGVVIRDVFYGIRNVATNEMIVPFDTLFGSTRVSSDVSCMFFSLDMSNLLPEKSYVVDILVVNGQSVQKYLNASQVFKISE